MRWVSCIYNDGGYKLTADRDLWRQYILLPHQHEGAESETDAGCVCVLIKYSCLLVWYLLSECLKETPLPVTGWAFLEGNLGAALTSTLSCSDQSLAELHVQSCERKSRQGYPEYDESG